ncbi:MAG: histidine kinase, partial [Bacteroidota bacterium]
MIIATDNNQKLYETFERAVQKGILYHIFFWVVFYLFLVIADNSQAPLGVKMITLGHRMVFYILIVSLNIYVLFPTFLKTDRLYSYLALLVISCLLITPLEVLLNYILLSHRTLSLSEAFSWKTNANYFLGIFFIAFSSSIYQIINDWIEHQRERKDLQRQQLKSELKFLKTQINPHFFFNTLNSLYALTLKKSDKAPEIVLKLSEMMRYMLYESNERVIPLEEEINYIQNYLEL